MVGAGKSTELWRPPYIGIPKWPLQVCLYVVAKLQRPRRQVQDCAKNEGQG